MADMEKFYDDLIIINLYPSTKIAKAWPGPISSATVFEVSSPDF